MTKMQSRMQYSQSELGMKALFDRWCQSTFQAVGLSKYYPPNSANAYYRMIYTPGQLILLHKSPSSPIIEKFEITYSSPSNFNMKEMKLFGDGQPYHQFNENELNSVTEPKSQAAILALRCLSKDPRAILSASDYVLALPSDNMDIKKYEVGFWDETVADPQWGVKLFAIYTVEKNILTHMVLKHFIGKKEITPQNMEIIFQF